MKKVIVISTSLRHGSNSDMLADQFVEGAKSAGNDVEKISLVGKNIQFCKGCLGCHKLGRCVINDDVNAIMSKVINADVVCWATPIYYYAWIIHTALRSPAKQKKTKKNKKKQFNIGFIWFCLVLWGFA